MRLMRAAPADDTRPSPFVKLAIDGPLSLRPCLEKSGIPVGKPLVLGVEGWVYGCRMISYRARCQHGALGATSRCVILAGPSHAVRPING